jgi:hypothetical protein
MESMTYKTRSLIRLRAGEIMLLRSEKLIEAAKKSYWWRFLAPDFIRLVGQP